MTSPPTIVDKIFSHLQHPVDKTHIEHDARVGAALEQSPSGEPGNSREELTRMLKAQGNNGTGMADGLHSKAIQQQQEVAERARLREQGLFEPHLKHEELVNKSDLHRQIADGANVSHGTSE